MESSISETYRAFGNNKLLSYEDIQNYIVRNHIHFIGYKFLRTLYAQVLLD